mmetsp:Transcript_2638/g.8918  ORF Transcript_2638/g.8918 Transcript_2638/m.8918 type:complete len:219 (+) Transcript_2638:656-1312(+)
MQCHAPYSHAHYKTTPPGLHDAQQLPTPSPLDEGPIPGVELPVVFRRGALHDAQQLPRGELGREELVCGNILLEGLGEVGRRGPRMQEDADGGVLFARHLDRHVLAQLVKCGLGGPVGVPPPRAVVPDAGHPRAHVGDHRLLPPLRRRGLGALHDELPEGLGHQRGPHGIDLVCRHHVLCLHPQQRRLRPHLPRDVQDPRHVDERVHTPVALGDEARC